MLDVKTTDHLHVVSLPVSWKRNHVQFNKDMSFDVDISCKKFAEKAF